LSSTFLAVVYVAIGLGCALPELFRSSKAGTLAQRIPLVLSALATVILWPLWAPFALAPRRRPRARTTDFSNGGEGSVDRSK
jgi:hypothetical protein